jgi:hypothetical protein
MFTATTSGRAGAALAAVAALLAFSLSAFGASRPKQPLRGFKLSGSVQGLYPGGRGTLAVAVRSPYRRKLRVVSLRVNVRDASRACRASNLSVKPFRGVVIVRPRGVRVVRLPVRMAKSAGDACRGARFPLRIAAKGILR